MKADWDFVEQNEVRMGSSAKMPERVRLAIANGACQIIKQGR